MLRHIDLLARLHRIWGALALAAGLSILIQAVGALAIVTSAGPAAPPTGLGAGLTVVLFFLFAFGAIAWGGFHVQNGAELRHRKPRARMRALTLAILNLFFLPFGTALAVYAFWVLLTDETRRAFESDAGGTTPAG